MHKSFLNLILSLLFAVVVVVGGMLDSGRIQRKIGNETYEWSIPQQYTASESERFFFWSEQAKNLDKIHDDYWKRKKTVAQKVTKSTYPCVNLKKINTFGKFFL